MTKLNRLLAFAALAAGALPEAVTATQRYGLHELRIAARAQHPTLESARAAVDAAAAFQRQQRLLEDPVTRLESARAENEAVSGTEWRVEVGQRLPLPGERRWRVRSADAGFQRTRYDQMALEALVDYEVGRLWVAAVLAGRAADVGAQSEAIAQRLLELIERRVEAGEASPLEALKARTEWFARRQLALQIKHELAGARATLDTFCNRSLGRDFELIGGLDSPGPLPSPEALRARLHESNPLLLSRRSSVTESEAGRAVERRGSFPDLELSIARESELDKEATAAGVSLRLPIWNRNRAAIAGAEANLRKSRAELDSSLLGLELELEQAMVEYRVSAEAITLYDEGWRAAARDAVKIASFSFENGESSLLELLDAQRSSLDVGLAEAEARARLTLARFRIEHLTGTPLDEVSSDENDN